MGEWIKNNKISFFVTFVGIAIFGYVAYDNYINTCKWESYTQPVVRNDTWSFEGHPMQTTKIETLVYKRCIRHGGIKQLVSRNGHENWERIAGGCY